MRFDSFAGLVGQLVTVEAEMGVALEAALERVAVVIEKTAKSEIGVYQSSIGGFPEWPELADSTEAQKAAMGYPADSPLLATGEMRDSISHETEALEAVVGSTDPTLVYHEFGTSKMPARPVLGPAAFKNKAKVEKLVGAAAVAGFVDGDRVHEALGYDITTKD